MEYSDFFPPSNENKKPLRQHPRYFLFWRIALLFDDTGERITFHGKTCDLSLYGAAMHTHHNIACGGKLIVLLAPPPLSAGERQKLIEIKAQIVYSVYSSKSMCFRIGLQFLSFTGKGREVLAQRLEHHTAALEVRPGCRAQDQ